MIVKDETHVLERCLSSVLPFLDAWLVVDTGSTDGTQQMVRDLLAGIPGELHERPWKDFAHNRSEALELARPLGDYSLMIDADEVFDAPDSFTWPDLTADVYALTHQAGATTYWLERMVANRLPWRYVGVLHEYLECEGVQSRERLPGPRIVGHYDGARSQGLTTVQKYARDAETLEKALAEEPGNARYQYYLARSYRDSQQWGRALLAFRKRATMGGFAEEVYDSLHAIAMLHEAIGSPPETIVNAYLTAYENRPVRAEPLCSLARYLREQKRFALARMFAAQAMTIPRPDDILFVDEDVYRWRCRDEFAVASYWTGDLDDAVRVGKQLVTGDDLPDNQRERIQRNLALALTQARFGKPS
jgi:tetratricopeptide (TPR) repeat protein